MVSFLMEHEQLSYPEALRYLARKYNIEIPEADDEEAQKEQAEKESLYIVSEFAERYFREQLHKSEEGRSIGLQYFKERDFTEETIEQFGLGFAPNKWDDLTKTATSKGYKLDFLEKTGLTKVKEEKRYDFFRERVIFPIHDITGRTVAFAGRALRDDQKGPKYLNSPESPIYHKSKILYGLYQAKKEIAQEERCYIVEGYTDVLALHQAGVRNVVATSGTALTREQVRVIKRMTRNVTLIFDSDEAGQQATQRGLDLFLEEAMHVKVLQLPEGKDPDSFSKDRDAEGLKQYFEENASDLIHYKAALSAEKAADDPVAKAEMVKGVTDSIALIPDHILRSFYIKECSQTLSVEEQALVMEVNKVRRKRIKEQRQKRDASEEEAPDTEQEQESKAPPQPKEFAPEAPIPQEQELIRIMIEYSQQMVPLETEEEEGTDDEEDALPLPFFIIQELDCDGIEMIDPRHKRIMDIFREHREETPGSSRIFELLMNEDPSLQEYAVHLTARKDTVSPNWREKHRIHTPTKDQNLLKIAHKGIMALKEKQIDKIRRETQEKLRSEGNSDEKVKSILEELRRWDVARKTFNNRLDRVVTH